MGSQEQQFLKCRWPKLVVFLASVTFTLVFWTILPATFRSNQSSDYVDFYEPVARNILNGAGITSDEGRPAIRYPPGYPLLLAAIFAISNFFNVTEGTMLSAFALMCMGTASVLVYMLARTIWGNFRALIASLLWITYPLSLWVTKQPNSELPFLVFLYAGFYLFWSSLANKQWTYSLFFVSGALIGLSMLIRPIAIAIVIIMSASLYFLARETKPLLRLLLIASMLMGNLVAVSPWETWVYLKTGEIIPLSAGGPGSVLDGLTFAVSDKGYRETIKVPSEVAQVMKDIQAASFSADANNSLDSAITTLKERLQTQPLTIVKLYAIKAARAWYATDSGRFESPIMMLQIPYFLLIILGSIAAWKRGGIAKQCTTGLWLIVFYFWGMTLTVLSIVRYMVPVMGLLFILVPGISERHLRRTS